MRTDETCFTRTILCPKLSTPKSLMKYDVMEGKTWLEIAENKMCNGLFCLFFFLPQLSQF